MHTFEIVIYNEQVRQLVSQGDSHKTFTDDWSDTHYIEFKADDEAAAIVKCRNKYSEDDGFVIESVSLV